MSVSVRPVTTAGERAAAYDVRRIVFVVEQHTPEDIDDDDATALHYIAIANGQVIGTGRLVIHADYAKVGRMAVLREWRSAGVGRALMDALTAEATRRHIPRLVLHAQVQAIGFYQRCGFIITSDQFDEAGIPHRRMEREISARST